MRLAGTLEGVELIGVDTAPFIYYVEKIAPYAGLILTVFEAVAAERLSIVTSVITVTEALVAPLDKGQTHDELLYRRMLLHTKSVRCVAVTTAIAEQAAVLRARYPLRTPDALQLATALDTGCDAFLTNDHAFRRVTDIPVPVLDDLQVDADAPRAVE